MSRATNAFFNRQDARRIRGFLRDDRSTRQLVMVVGRLHLNIQPPTLRNPRATLWCYYVGDEPPTTAHLAGIRQLLQENGSDVVRGQNAVKYGQQHGYIFTWLPNPPTDRR